MQHTCQYDKISLSRWKLYLKRDFPLNDPSKCICPDRFDGVRGPYRHVDASEHARVFQCELAFHGKVEKVFFKQYLCRSFKDIIKNMVRPGRAKRSLWGSVLLEENGFGVPGVVAVGERKIGPILAGEFSLTTELEGTRDVTRFLKDDFHDAPKKRITFVRQLGETIGRMHSLGISHGDLRPGNVMARENEDGYEFFFLDNERTRKFRKLPMKLRLKNLVQINMLHSDMVSKTDRMRFFNSYMKHNPDLKDGYNTIANKVMTRTYQRLNS